MALLACRSSPTDASTSGALVNCTGTHQATEPTTMQIGCHSAAAPQVRTAHGTHHVVLLRGLQLPAAHTQLCTRKAALCRPVDNAACRGRRPPPAAAAPPAIAGPSGAWSGWLDRDTVDNEGDFENIEGLTPHPCNSVTPIAAECRVVGTNQSAAAAGQVLERPCGIEGMSCRHTDQPGGSCEDYEVRYLCPGACCSLVCGWEWGASAGSCTCWWVAWMAAWVGRWVHPLQI